MTYLSTVGEGQERCGEDRLMEKAVEEFVEAIQRGKQVELARAGFASVAGLIAMFYEGLKDKGLPGQLVYILTCNFAAQATAQLILSSAEQAMAGGKGGVDPGAELPSED